MYPEKYLFFSFKANKNLSNICNDTKSLTMLNIESEAKMIVSDDIIETFSETKSRHKHI